MVRRKQGSRDVKLETDKGAESQPRLAIALRLTAAALLACMYAGVKWAAEHGVKVGESLFYRQAGSALCATAWLATRAGFRSLRTRRINAHVLRMAIGLSAMAASFSAMVLLPLAEATAIAFSVPVFSTLLAATLLREPTGPWRWTAVVVGLLGVLLILQPASGHITPLGASVAIVAALATAGANVAIRRLGATEAAATTVFWFAFSSLVPLGIIMPFIAQPHDATTLAVIAGLSLAGGVAQLTLTGSLRLAPVAVVAPMDYSSLVWASVLGWFVFGQIPSRLTVVGSLILIAAGLTIVWREQCARRSRGFPG